MSSQPDVPASIRASNCWASRNRSSSQPFFCDVASLETPLGGLLGEGGQGHERERALEAVGGHKPCSAMRSRMVGDPESKGEPGLLQGELSNTTEMLPHSSGEAWLTSSGGQTQGGMGGNGGIEEGEGARPNDTLAEGAAEAGDSWRQGERRLGDGTAAAAGGALEGSNGGALQQRTAGKSASPALSQVASSESSSPPLSATRCRGSGGLGGNPKRDCDGDVLGLASAVGVGTSAGNGEQRVGASGSTRPLVAIGVVAGECSAL